VTGRPIKFAGTGEKLDQFEAFVPIGWQVAFSAWATFVAWSRKPPSRSTRSRAKRMQGQDAEGELRLGGLPGAVQNDAQNGALGDVLGMIPGMSQMKDVKIDS